MADNGLREEPIVQCVSYPTCPKQFGAVGHDVLRPALLSEAWHSEIPVQNCSLIYDSGCSERKHSPTEITRHFWEGQAPAHVASMSFHDVSTIAQKRENTAYPVYESGIHSTPSEDVDLDLVWPALLNEAWYSGVLTPNCSMIYGDGCSERQRSSTETTLHASEGHFPVHMASKSFHEDLDRDTPTSKCFRERENTVPHVNGFGIHSTAHMGDDRDLLWPHTGAPVLNSNTTSVRRGPVSWLRRTLFFGTADERKSVRKEKRRTRNPILSNAPARASRDGGEDPLNCLAMGGRVLMLWANDIEESGGTLEERRAGQAPR